MRFFFERYWTVGTLLIIINALFVIDPGINGAEEPEKKVNKPVVESTDNRMAETETQLKLAIAEEELKVLRQELFDILKKYEKQNEEYQKLQLTIAATLKNSEVRSFTVDQKDLLKSLETVANAGSSLATKTINLCEYLDDQLDELSADKIKRIKIRYRLEEVKAEAERVRVLIELPEAQRRIDKCKILTLNKKLQVVVLAAGSLQGVRNGLVWYVEEKENCKLRVIVVRPYISAALVVEGDFDDLLPGMTAQTSKIK